VDGLVKRPSTRYVGTLESSNLSADSLVHIINHDSDNRHVLVITPSSNTAKVYNTSDGSTVSTLSNSYVNVAKPRESLKALTIANTTYILNKTTTTAMDTSQTSAALAKEAIIFVKQGDYSKEYTVTIDGTDKTYTTGDGQHSHTDLINGSTGTAAGDGTDASSETIAAGLVSAIGTISGITIVRNGSVIKLTSTNSTFTVSVRDGLSNIGLGMAYQEVSAITDLPKSCYQGFTVKVKGDVELVQDDYYVKFVVKEGDSVAAGTFGEGSWEETIGPEVQTTINNATMPIKLVPATGFGSYTLNTTTWTNRLVGDADNLQ
jgi:hypothetical protein